MATITAAAGGGNSNSGGTWVGGVVPTAADDVVLASTSGNVTINAQLNCRSLNCRASGDYSGTLTMSERIAIGDGTPGAGNVALGLSPDMTLNIQFPFEFKSTSSTAQTITTCGKTLPAVQVTGAGSRYKLADDIAASTQISIASGEFDANGHNVTTGNVSCSGTSTRSLILGSGTWTITDTQFTPWQFTTTTNLTFSGADATIRLVDNGSSAKSFAGGGLAYGIVEITAGGSGRWTFSGSNTFEKLTRSGSGTKNIRFTAGTTTTLTGGADAFFGLGDGVNQWTIDTSSAGSAATLASGTNLSSDWLSLKDITAPAGTNYAGANSTNVSGNTNWTFTASPAPTLTDCDPSTGTIHGGTAVTLTGTNLTGSTGATFGGDAATGFSVTNDTTIACTTPAHAAGLVDVVIVHDDGNATLTNGFEYVTPAPTLSSIDPATGSTAGGTSVTITGTDLTDTSGVTFDGEAATSVNVVNDTTVTCVTPAHAAGAVDVVLTTPGGSDTLEGGFTYFRVSTVLLMGVG